MTDEKKRKQPSGGSPAPQMAAQPMSMGMGAQAPMAAQAPMGNPVGGAPGMGLSTGQLTNPTGMVGMPGMQPGFQEPDPTGSGETYTTIGPEQVAAAMEKLKKYMQGVYD